MSESGHERSPYEPNAIDHQIGAQVRLRRMTLGMSPRDLASLLNVDIAGIEAIEAGRIRLSVSQIFEVARVLDVPIQFFYEHLDVSDSSQAALSAIDTPPSQPLTDAELAALRAKLLESFNALEPRLKRRLVEIAQVLASNAK